MENQLHKTLQSLLKITASPQPPKHLEQLKAWVSTNLQLYQQEDNKEAYSLYQELDKLVSKAKSIKEVEALL